MRRAPWLALLALVGCGDPLELSVDLRTDLRPGLEMDAVEVRWTDPQGVLLGSETIDARSGDFARGERLVDVAGLTPGIHLVDVTVRAGGAPVASRGAVVDLRADTAITVLITRDCGDVTCAEPGRSACLDGRCVDPACRPGRPEACPAPSCVTATDCPAPAVPCLRAECVSGACFELADDARCGPAEACDPALGCVGGPIEEDAGPPIEEDAGPPVPVDAGPCTATETRCADGVDDDCDGDRDCADADCAGASCDDGDPCTFGDACGAGVCAGTPITCASDDCVTRSCNGTASCDEAPRPDGVACTDDGNPCTNDVCGGGSCLHPARTGSCPDEGNPCTNDVCSGGVCTHPARPDGTSLGGFSRCCGGAPTDVSTDRNHCGACGLRCSGSYACTVYGGQPTCDCGAANSECHGGGADFLCSTSYGVCACLRDAACPGTARCVARAGGPDYCTY